MEENLENNKCCNVNVGVNFVLLPFAL